jgi:hypothetical protein
MNYTYMYINGRRVEVKCTASVSNKGIPYLGRELIVENEEIAYTVSVHVYPKTTTALVIKDCPDGEEYQGLYKIASSLYRQDAPTFIEQVLRVAGRGDGMVRTSTGTFENGLFGVMDVSETVEPSEIPLYHSGNDYMGMSEMDWGDK